MSTTKEIIDRLKALKSPRLTSDNQVAAVLGVTRQAVSRWQHGQDAMGLRVLENVRQVLKLSDAEYVELGLRLQVERNKRNPKDARFWEGVVVAWQRAVRKSGTKLSSILLGVISATGRLDRWAVRGARGARGGGITAGVDTPREVRAVPAGAVAYSARGSSCPRRRCAFRGPCHNLSASASPSALAASGTCIWSVP